MQTKSTFHTLNSQTLAFIDNKMRINTLLNVITLLLIFTPFLKCCEGQEAEPEEYSEETEVVASDSLLTQIDTVTTITENSIYANNGEESQIDTVESNEDELNFAQQVLIFLAYPEGIFTSVSGFGLILELWNAVFSEKPYSDWYFALLVHLSIVIFIASIAIKKFTKLNYVNSGIMILTWITMISVSRIDSILWGFSLYTIALMIKPFLTHKLNRTTSNN